MNVKRIITCAAAVITAACALCLAQTEKSQVIEGGGTGPYKSVAVGDASLPTHMIYRPENLYKYVDENGKIPVLLYANGACANNSLEMSRLLSEVASYGYFIIAIGPYEDMPDDKFYAQWKGVVRGWYPETKPVAIMGNGERLTPYTEAELAERAAQQEAERKAAEAAAKKNRGKKAAAPAPQPFRTYARQLLEALDWLTDQNADAKSEYYHMIDLDKVAAMGQSCGGAQVLAIAHDPRIKSCMIFNSGIGEMSMSGASKESLANLHTPMLYINGGVADVAYANANGDWDRIPDLPVVKISTLDGHHGTYYEKHAGAFAVVARMWLNWQLKGKVADSALFLNDEYGKALYPDWTFDRKNW